ncbi:hypothetical protein Ddc_13104 [Ditylenchus destructor]|nr:hypothetical protein Ddc_13104 [Ditylenchus destructor]
MTKTDCSKKNVTFNDNATNGSSLKNEAVKPEKTFQNSKNVKQNVVQYTLKWSREFHQFVCGEQSKWALSYTTFIKFDPEKDRSKLTLFLAKLLYNVDTQRTAGSELCENSDADKEVLQQLDRKQLANVHNVVTQLYQCCTPEARVWLLSLFQTQPALKFEIAFQPILLCIQGTDSANKFVKMPYIVLRTRRLASAGDYLFNYVDPEGRTYHSWKNFLATNTLAACYFAYPRDGLYSVLARRNLQIEYAHSPACTSKQKLLGVGDSISAVCGTTLSVVTVAAIAAPSVVVLGPTAATVASVAGSVTGTFVAARALGKLIDRKQHSQSISLAKADNLHSWISVASGLFMQPAVLFLNVDMASKVMYGNAAGFSCELRVLYDALNVTQIGFSVINIGSMVSTWVTERRKPSMMECAQFSLSLFFLSRTVSNYKTASKVIAGMQKECIDRFIKRLSTSSDTLEKLREEICKLYVDNPDLAGDHTFRNLNLVEQSEQKINSSQDAKFLNNLVNKMWAEHEANEARRLRDVPLKMANTLEAWEYDPELREFLREHFHDKMLQMDKDFVHELYVIGHLKRLIAEHKPEHAEALDAIHNSCWKQEANAEDGDMGKVSDTMLQVLDCVKEEPGELDDLIEVFKKELKGQSDCGRTFVEPLTHHTLPQTREKINNGYVSDTYKITNTSYTSQQTTTIDSVEMDFRNMNFGKEITVQVDENYRMEEIIENKYLPSWPFSWNDKKGTTYEQHHCTKTPIYYRINLLQRISTRKIGPIVHHKSDVRTVDHWEENTWIARNIVRAGFMIACNGLNPTTLFFIVFSGALKEPLEKSDLDPIAKRILNGALDATTGNILTNGSVTGADVFLGAWKQGAVGVGGELLDKIPGGNKLTPILDSVVTDAGNVPVQDIVKNGIAAGWLVAAELDDKVKPANILAQALLKADAKTKIDQKSSGAVSMPSFVGEFAKQVINCAVDKEASKAPNALEGGVLEGFRRGGHNAVDKAVAAVVETQRRSEAAAAWKSSQQNAEVSKNSALPTTSSSRVPEQDALAYNEIDKSGGSILEKGVLTLDTHELEIANNSSEVAPNLDHNSQITKFIIPETLQEISNYYKGVTDPHTEAKSTEKDRLILPGLSDYAFAASDSVLSNTPKYALFKFDLKFHPSKTRVIHLQVTPDGNKTKVLFGVDKHTFGVNKHSYHVVPAIKKHRPMSRMSYKIWEKIADAGKLLTESKILAELVRGGAKTVNIVGVFLDGKDLAVAYKEGHFVETAVQKSIPYAGFGLGALTCGPPCALGGEVAGQIIADNVPTKHIITYGVAALEAATCGAPRVIEGARIGKIIADTFCTNSNNSGEKSSSDNRTS